jgi:hypothetical protein
MVAVSLTCFLMVQRVEPEFIVVVQMEEQREQQLSLLIAWMVYVLKVELSGWWRQLWDSLHVVVMTY